MLFSNLATCHESFRSTLHVRLIKNIIAPLRSKTLQWIKWNQTVHSTLDKVGGFIVYDPSV